LSIVLTSSIPCFGKKDVYARYNKTASANVKLQFR
jgi:hypothetical protein